MNLWRAIGLTAIAWGVAFAIVWFVTVALGSGAIR